MAPQESCFKGDSGIPTSCSLFVVHSRFFSFQHNLMVSGLGSLKLGIGSLKLGALSLLPWKSHLQPLFSEPKPGRRGQALTSWVHLSVQYPVRMKASSPGGMAITGV